MFKRLWNLYNRGLESHPWKVVCTQTGLLMGVGDFAAQKFETYGLEPTGSLNLDYNYKRTLILIIFGVFNAGPIMKLWYAYLDKFYGVQTNLTNGLRKMITDQIIFAPFILFDFLVCTELLKGSNLDKIEAKVKKEYLDIMLTNYLVWPTVQLINMSIVPLQYRILVVNLVALVFNSYLSHKTNAH